MTIAYVNSGTFAAGTTSAAPGVPSSPAAGNRFVAFVGSKPFNATVGTPSNYTKLATSTSGTEVVGNGTGSCFCVAFDHSVTGSESGTVSFTVTTGDPAMARIHQFSKSSSMAWDVAATALADTNNAGNNLISATGSAIDIQSGDMLVFACPMPNDNDLIASPVMTVPGCTVGSVTQIATDVTTVGNDAAIFYYRASVTAGASTGAPVFTAVTGVLAGGGSDPDDAAVPLVRLREVAPERGSIASTMPHFTSSFGGSVTAASGVSGDAASTMPHFTASFAGSVKNNGSIASTMPHFTSSISGTVKNNAVLGAMLGSFTASFSGNLENDGGIASSLGSFTCSMSGALENDGDLASTMPAFSCELTGIPTNSGTVASSLGAFTCDMSGVLENDGSIAGTLPSFTCEFDAQVVTEGGIASTLGSFTCEVEGTIGSTATGELASVMPGFICHISQYNSNATFTATIEAEDRTFKIQGEVRVSDVTADARTTVVQPEDRSTLMEVRDEAV